MSDSMATPPRLKAIQRTALVFLVIIGVVNYVDRATLAIANPLIRQDLGLSVADMGLLLSSFLWAYAFAQLPAGGLIDRIGPRLMLTIGLSLWSVAQVLGGFVTSFAQFTGARVLLGLGEAPHFPTCARVMRDWFNVRQRGTATGIWNCASTLGTAISAPLLTALMLGFGWRWMFAIMGVAGLGVAAAFYATFRNPNQVALSDQEREFLTEGDTGITTSRVTFADWRRLFRFRTTWGMIIGFFGTIYMTWVYTAWLPGYLEMDRHMSLSKTGIVAAIPFAFGVVGSIGGGRLCDWLTRRGLSPINSRKYPMAVSLLLTSILTVVAAETPSNTLAMTCISASMFLLYISSTAAWAMAPIAAPANCTASLGAIQNFGGYLGGALAPTVTGFIVQASGSFEPALLTGAAVTACAAIGYLIAVRGPIPTPDAETARPVPLGQHITAS